ncbi:MAG: hypothetical protein LBU53_07600 [Zoogloeaceae bacterium]|jgi:hypothetical protein|nr:hypothetical protein [Zoogloeaceae bacterium]
MSKIAIRNIALYLDKKRVDVKVGETLPEGVSAADLKQLERLNAIGDPEPALADANVVTTAPAPAAPKAAPKTTKAAKE